MWSTPGRGLSCDRHEVRPSITSSSDQSTGITKTRKKFLALL